MTTKMITEEQARQSTKCPACGVVKDKGLVVCWDCFKYCTDNLKNSGDEFEVWLKRVHVKYQK